MTKLSFFSLLGALLLCSGISDNQTGMSHDDHQNPVKEKEFSQHDNKAMDDKQAAFCVVCKAIIRKVLNSIGKAFSKNDIDQQLNTVCRKMKIPGCRKFLQKYKTKLINALVSGDNYRTICVKLKLCKQKYM
ncbi:antimicrobial peptide NK-lysin [Myxocyprinus asiaticus]|uniref:antimicrobial peptide NK-lysin n=1 Tax=Myxocyprinus asiaticus TaxID=70543 RepID=UPI0022230A6F|nr:antimicrobial peptide NK-lysin [Myxocyprinus asiaticus]